jgi:hypothetical protein
LRKITMSEIQANIANKGQLVDYTVNLFRGKTKEEGWNMKRTRPRSTDEIKALNYISRKAICTAMKEGTIQYDQERRVITFAEYSRS